MTMGTKLAAGLFAAAGLLAALPGVAAAETTDEDPTEQTGDGSALDHRLEVACDRVPVATLRVEQTLARILGDADERGSIEWLEARADQARDTGRDELADLIDGRVSIRHIRVELLEARLDWLADAQQFCDGL